MLKVKLIKASPNKLVQLNIDQLIAEYKLVERPAYLDKASLSASYHVRMRTLTRLKAELAMIDLTLAYLSIFNSRNYKFAQPASFIDADMVNMLSLNKKRDVIRQAINLVTKQAIRFDRQRELLVDKLLQLLELDGFQLLVSSISQDWDTRVIQADQHKNELKAAARHLISREIKLLYKLLIPSLRPRLRRAFCVRIFPPPTQGAEENEAMNAQLHSGTTMRSLLNSHKYGKMPHYKFCTTNINSFDLPKLAA